VVEHDLAKVGVEGSNPFARSKIFRMAKFVEGPLPSGLFAFRKCVRQRPTIRGHAAGVLRTWFHEPGFRNLQFQMPHRSAQNIKLSHPSAPEEISSQFVLT
jgi:hypothetical protein